ncbi:hypothetical protein [Longispora albida]|uniref:hypothetical protein n=1 Tax=Longispora albida TaxID=203523 RepID=UPI00036BEB71|nr:hypothetical protein [Longispora albida]
MNVDRETLIELLAGYGDRPAAEVDDRLDSLDLAWLVHAVEQRYGVRLDLPDATLAGMTTVDAALDVLRAHG